MWNLAREIVGTHVKRVTATYDLATWFENSPEIKENIRRLLTEEVGKIVALNFSSVTHDPVPSGLESPSKIRYESNVFVVENLSALINAIDDAVDAAYKRGLASKEDLTIQPTKKEFK